MKASYIEQVFIRITSVKKHTNYNNCILLEDIFINENECALGYTKATIRIDKSLKVSELMMRKIADSFPNSVRAVLIDKGTTHTNNYLEIYYIDRKKTIAYKIACKDTVYYCKSGGIMKDIRKYNKNNSNHILVRKGERLPSSIENGILKYKKTIIWSNKQSMKKRQFTNMIEKIKNKICKIINYISTKSNNVIRYITDKHWKLLGLRFINQEIRSLKKLYGKEENINKYILSVKEKVRKSNKEKILNLDLNTLQKLEF